MSSHQLKDIFKVTNEQYTNLLTGGTIGDHQYDESAIYLVERAANDIELKGTSNTIAKFTSETTIGDSNITDNDSVISIGEGLQISKQKDNGVIILGDQVILPMDTQNGIMLGGNVSIPTTATGIISLGDNARFPLGKNQTITFGQATTVPEERSNIAVLGGGDLQLRGGTSDIDSDAGDVIFATSEGLELARIWVDATTKTLRYRYADTTPGEVNHEHLIAMKDLSVQKAGDTITGKLDFTHNGTRRLRLWADGEGANIRMTTPGNANNCYEFDTCDNVLRLYYSTDDGGGANYKDLTLMDENGVTNFSQRPTFQGKALALVEELGSATRSSDYPTGFNSRETSITWGTLATGHTYITRWDTSNGGSVAFAQKQDSSLGWQTHMQIDGFFYQNEGANKVLDTSNVSGTANAIAKFTTTNTIGSSNISDDNTTITLGKSVVVSGELEASGTVEAYQFKTAHSYLRIGGSEGEAIGTGSRAISIGSNANASGSRSIAIGSGDSSSAAKASGSYSIAIGGCYSGGTPAQATNDGTTSIGGGASSTGYYSTALGYHAAAGAWHGLALGAESTANYSSSVAIGYSVDTSQSGEVNINNSIITKAVSVYCSSNSAFSTGITLPAFSSGFIIISSEAPSADSYYHYSFRYDGSTLRTAEVASYCGPTVSMSGSTLYVKPYRNTFVRYTVMVLYTIDHY